MSSFFSSLFNSNKEEIFTIAFYNVENLFDTKDNPKTADDAFTSQGKRRWSYKKYTVLRFRCYSECVSKLLKRISMDGATKKNSDIRFALTKLTIVKITKLSL